MPTPILYVHHRAQVSGAARSLASLLEHLDDRFEPHVLTPEGPVVEIFEAAGARVSTAPVSLLQHTWDNPYAGRKWLLLAREAAALAPHLVSLERLLRSREFALVHLNDSPLLAAGATARLHGTPVVWHLRSALSTGGSIRRTITRRIIERTGAAAIAIDRDVARSFGLRLPTEIVFNSVEQPVGPVDRAAARARLGMPEGRVTVGFMGNLRRIKGWPQLLEAVAASPELRVQVVVVGGGVRPSSFFQTPYGRTVRTLGLAGDDEAELRGAVEAHGLGDRVTFVPFTDDVGSVYAALDVVAFPNQGIGLGRPVLEAAAYGVPSIAAGSSDGAGVVIPDRTGLLLPEASPAALAAGLRRLVDDPRLRAELGANAAAHAAENFDPRRNAASVAAVYARVLADPALALSAAS